eukprot:Rmarinus@m.22362
MSSPLLNRQPKRRTFLTQPSSSHPSSPVKRSLPPSPSKKEIEQSAVLDLTRLSSSDGSGSEGSESSDSELAPMLVVANTCGKGKGGLDVSHHEMRFKALEERLRKKEDMLQQMKEKNAQLKSLTSQCKHELIKERQAHESTRGKLRHAVESQRHVEGASRRKEKEISALHDELGDAKAQLHSLNPRKQKTMEKDLNDKTYLLAKKDDLLDAVQKKLYTEEKKRKLFAEKYKNQEAIVQQLEDVSGAAWQEVQAERSLNQELRARCSKLEGALQEAALMKKKLTAAQFAYSKLKHDQEGLVERVKFAENRLEDMYHKTGRALVFFCLYKILLMKRNRQLAFLTNEISLVAASAKSFALNEENCSVVLQGLQECSVDKEGFRSELHTLAEAKEFVSCIETDGETLGSLRTGLSTLEGMDMDAMSGIFSELFVVKPSDPTSEAIEAAAASVPPSPGSKSALVSAATAEKTSADEPGPLRAGTSEGARPPQTLTVSVPPGADASQRSPGAGAPTDPGSLSAAPAATPTTMPAESTAADDHSPLQSPHGSDVSAPIMLGSSSPGASGPASPDAAPETDLPVVMSRAGATGSAVAVSGSRARGLAQGRAAENMERERLRNVKAEVSALQRSLLSGDIDLTRVNRIASMLPPSPSGAGAIDNIPMSKRIMMDNMNRYGAMIDEMARKAEAANEQNSRLVEELRIERRKYEKDMANEKKRFHNETTTKQKKIDRLEAKLSAANEEIEKMKAQATYIVELQQQADSLRIELTSSSEKISSLTAELQTVAHNLEAETALRAAVERQVQDLKSQTKEEDWRVREKLADREKQVAKITLELRTTQSEMARALHDVDEAKAEVLRSRESTGKLKDIIKEKDSLLEKQKLALQTKYSSLVAKVRDLGAENGSLKAHIRSRKCQHEQIVLTKEAHRVLEPMALNPPQEVPPVDVFLSVHDVDDYVRSLPGEGPSVEEFKEMKSRIASLTEEVETIPTLKETIKRLEGALALAETGGRRSAEDELANVKARADEAAEKRAQAMVAAFVAAQEREKETRRRTNLVMEEVARTVQSRRTSLAVTVGEPSPPTSPLPSPPSVHRALSVPISAMNTPKRTRSAGSSKGSPGKVRHPSGRSPTHSAGRSPKSQSSPVGGSGQPHRRTPKKRAKRSVTDMGSASRLVGYEGSGEDSGTEGAGVGDTLQLRSSSLQEPSSPGGRSGTSPSGREKESMIARVQKEWQKEARELGAGSGSDTHGSAISLEQAFCL